MLQLSKLTKLILIIALFMASLTFAQHKSMHMKGMKSDKQSSDSNLVRKGIIDLKSIDKNNDSKVYQCPMGANVLSDEKGECPLCGMNIKEVTVEKAKEKLLKRGFEVKEHMTSANDKSEVKTDLAKTNIWNKVCPVMGEEVDSETPTEMYNGKVIGFCCKGCEKKFNADPEKYMKNLSEDGTQFIGKK